MDWEYLVIPLTALIASLLTFFSGFGLGTILTPVFAIFFPVELAIALTAIVHLLNNLFKFLLIGRNTVTRIFLKFGTASVIGAIVGSLLLITMRELSINYSVSIAGFAIQTNLMKVVIGLLILFFALFELIPTLRNYQFPKSWFVPGGLLSGFFGGISGHQGALRSAFLIKYSLAKEQFIATGIAIALIVDIVRITFYGTSFYDSSILEMKGILSITVISAFLGATLGRQLLDKVTLKYVEQTVGGFLLVMGLLITLGIV